MKYEDVAKYSGKSVEITLMPNADKRTGILHCKEDHIEINGELLAYQLIWGLRIIDPEKPAKKSVYDQAVKYFQNKQLDKAAKLYLEAIKQDEHRKQALNVLFRIYIKQKKYSEARKLLDTYGKYMKAKALKSCNEELQKISPEVKKEVELKKEVKKVKKPAAIMPSLKFLKAVRQQAYSEYLEGNFIKAVSTCDSFLSSTAASLQGKNIPDDVMGHLANIYRILALSLYMLGNKKRAKTIAKVIINIHTMNMDAKLREIIEDTGDNNTPPKKNFAPDISIWPKISQVHNIIRDLIRSKLPEKLKIKPDELDNILLSENLIPNPGMHNIFIENTKQNHNINSSLIDVVSLEILGGIIGHYWENVFAEHFGNKPYYGYWDEKFSRLNVIRNSIAHAHAEYLSDDDISEAEGICNEILEKLMIGRE